MTDRNIYFPFKYFLFKHKKKIDEVGLKFPARSVHTVKKIHYHITAVNLPLI